MKVDVSGIRNVNGAQISLNGECQFDPVTFFGEEYRFEQPVQLVGVLINIGTKLELTAKVKGSVSAKCARCGKPLRCPFQYELREVLTSESAAADMQDDDIIVFEGNEINVDEIALNNFIMNAPMRYLCKEDCKGLCQKCGKDLNEGSCSCKKDEIDPRLAILDKLF